jgi:hypothetical protein
MRLSGVSLPVVLFFATSSVFAQHSSGGGSSSGSSSGGGSHSSSSGGSGSSGGGSSHSSGSFHGSGGSLSASGGGHSSSGAHTSGSTSIYRGSGSHGKTDHGSNLTPTTRNGSGQSEVPRPIHEPRVTNPERIVPPEKRGFFSRLFHPARKPQPKPEPKPALYLPPPICPHGRCAPACPVGQTRNGTACTTPIIRACVSGQIWNDRNACVSPLHGCPLGKTWNGINCVYATHFLNMCSRERAALEQQMKRLQAAASKRDDACANGSTQECSEATALWQSEMDLWRNLLAQYQRCQTNLNANRGYYSPAYDSIGWFDSLRFDTSF